MSKLITIPIISFIGRSNSGKTASIESVVKYLIDKGYECNVLKHIHRDNFTADTPGKNTWRFSQSGAKVVVAQSKHESALFFNEQLPPLKIIDWICRIGIEENLFKNPQRLVFVLEGFRDIGDRQILCLNNRNEIAEQLTPTIKFIAGNVSNNPEDITYLTQKYQLPVINIVRHPEMICDLYSILHD